MHINIGKYRFNTPVILAPMAGVTDRPFRDLCYRHGADLCVSEMVTSEKHLWKSRKTQRRLDHSGETGIRSVQIAGTDPVKMADAARFNVEHGAQIIDINMGCPAKKVCNVLAGSALLKNEVLVAEIVSAVVSAVNVPVTLKLRTGWDRNSRNAVNVARIAEQNGIRMLAIHGRTRADAYKGEAEYDTIAEVKCAVSVPVIANGDITSPEKAAAVLEYTKADGLMIGRGSWGKPWIFNQIKHYLSGNCTLPTPEYDKMCQLISRHLRDIYQFYGEDSGVRIARKHIGWYINNYSGADLFRSRINKIDNAGTQLEMVMDFFKSQQPLLAA